MKKTVIDKDLLKSSAIGMRRDFEKCNKKRVAKGEKKLSFFEFSKGYVENYEKTSGKVSVICLLIFAVVCFWIDRPATVVEGIIWPVCVLAVGFLLWRFNRKTTLDIKSAIQLVVDTCNDKNIDIYKYIDDREWKNNKK